MEKHSKLPWGCKNFIGSNGWTILAAFTTDKSRDFAEYTLKADTPIPIFIQPWSQFPSTDYEEMMQANAELIVKAVNSHAKLVELLTRCEQALEDRYNPRLKQEIKALLKHLESNPLTT